MFRLKQFIKLFFFIICLSVGLLVILNIPVTSQQGVNYVVRTIKMPLYIKIIEFLDRDYHYKELAEEICRGCGSDKDRYNVIHQIEQLKGKRLRSQREELIRLLEIAQAKKRRLKSLTVVFDGQTDVLAPRLRSTVKVIFSRGTSADKKIKEIVSLGIPAVCTRIGAVLGFIQDNVNGFLARTEEEWIEKLSLLIENPELRQRIGMAGRRTVEEKYSLEVNAPKYLEVLMNCTNVQSNNKNDEIEL